MQLLTALGPVLLLLAPVYAWGQLGHRTTAVLASRFLLPDAASKVRQLLQPDSLVAAVTWADYYSHTQNGRYSAPWHWIDAKDSPPKTCEVRYSRDCLRDQGCIISAIVNHTARAVDLSEDWDDRQMSLKWVIHFLGDIHQPLHTEDMMRGGNGIQVTWDGKPSNLHHVWDTEIPEKLRGGSSIRDAVSWADKLYTDIQEGRWGNETERWGECVDVVTAEKCALSWASATNKLMCSYVLPQDFPGGWNGVDLSESYYEGAIEIVEEQVAMAGWRMGMWLNAMFAPAAEREVDQSVLDKMIKLIVGGDL